MTYTDIPVVELSTPFGFARLACHGASARLLPAQDDDKNNIPLTVNGVEYITYVDVTRNEEGTFVLMTPEYQAVNMRRRDSFNAYPSDSALRKVRETLPPLINEYLQATPDFVREGYVVTLSNIAARAEDAYNKAKAEYEEAKERLQFANVEAEKAKIDASRAAARRTA